MTDMLHPAFDGASLLPLLATERTGNLPALLTTKEVAQALRVHPETVERWRRAEGGPRYRRLTGGAIRYTAADVAEYIERSVQGSGARRQG
ncbi:MAG: helix-turn-helix domain-containing protein [Rhodospirillaceae bacterium]